MNDDNVIFLNGIEGKKEGRSWGYNAKKIMRLFFGSTLMNLIAIAILGLAVWKGDAFSKFLGNSVINLDSFLSDMLGDGMAYLISCLLSSVVLMGPIHYYAVFNLVDVLVILLIVYLILGIVVAFMFKHPVWAFLGGIAIMTGFNVSVYGIITMLDYYAGGAIPIDISSTVFALLQGIYGYDNILILLFTSSIENGIILGLFSMFWGAIFSPKKKKSMVDVSFNCSQGDVCKI